MEIENSELKENDYALKIRSHYWEMINYEQAYLKAQFQGGNKLSAQREYFSNMFQLVGLTRHDSRMITAHKELIKKVHEFMKRRDTMINIETLIDLGNMYIDALFNERILHINENK